MKLSISALLVVLLYSIISPIKTVYAADSLLINEFSSGTSSDWVELYNPTSDALDLTNYVLADLITNGTERDYANSNKKDLSDIPVTILDVGAFVKVDFSNYLNIDGDMVRLYKKGITEPIDSIGYGTKGVVCAASSSESIGRKPDGSGSIVKFVSPTIGAVNNTNVVACSSPTPTTSPTAIPSSSPTPTPTLAPTTAQITTDTIAVTSKEQEVNVDITLNNIKDASWLRMSWKKVVGSSSPYAGYMKNDKGQWVKIDTLSNDEAGGCTKYYPVENKDGEQKLSLSTKIGDDSRITNGDYLLKLHLFKTGSCNQGPEFNAVVYVSVNLPTPSPTPSPDVTPTSTPKVLAAVTSLLEKPAASSVSSEPVERSLPQLLAAPVTSPVASVAGITTKKSGVSLHSKLLLPFGLAATGLIMLLGASYPLLKPNIIELTRRLKP